MRDEPWSVSAVEAGANCKTRRSIATYEAM